MEQCDLIDLGGGNSAIICSSGGRTYKCDFCRQRKGENQCDFVVGPTCRKCKGHGERSMNKTEQRMHQAFIQSMQNPVEGFSTAQAEAGLINLAASLVCHDCAGTGKQMCNRYFCGTECGIRISEKEGYCPTHQASAGYPKKLKRERCLWAKFEGQGSKCLRKECQSFVQPGETCMFFPDRQRAMHPDCGDKYLKVSS